MSHQDGISLRRFAEQIGVSERVLVKWCRAGKVIGARKHPLTKKWTIYSPAKLALDSMTGNSLRMLPGYVAPQPAVRTDEPKPVVGFRAFPLGDFSRKGGAA